MYTGFSGRRAAGLDAVCMLMENDKIIKKTSGHIESHTIYFDFVGDDGSVEHLDYRDLVQKSENSWSSRVYPIELHRHLVIQITDCRYSERK